MRDDTSSLICFYPHSHALFAAYFHYTPFHPRFRILYICLCTSCRVWYISSSAVHSAWIKGQEGKRIFVVFFAVFLSDETEEMGGESFWQKEDHVYVHVWATTMKRVDKDYEWAKKRKRGGFHWMALCMMKERWRGKDGRMLFAGHHLE